jgi:Lon protease-like protein
MENPTAGDGFTSAQPGTVLIPEVIPIFPLPRTVLLPGEVLPLHIFEPRYRDMVQDALASHRIIGMVESLPDSTTTDIGLAEVRGVGCVGFIAQYQELPDGRFLLWLLGLERFRINEEISAATRYRQVRVDYVPIEEPADRLAGIQPLRRELKTLLPELVETDHGTRQLLAGQMDEVSDPQLIALACHILELDSLRKREILEARTLVDRFLMVYEDVYRHLDQNPEFSELDENQLN